MKSLQHILALSLLLSLGACQFLGQGSGRSEIGTIKNGYSFGECIGFCVGDMVVEQNEQTLTLSTWISNEAEEYQGIHAASAWNEIQNAIDIDAFCGMADVYGCPDCADGGAEYLSMICDGQEKTVTFEFGTTDLVEINPLLELLRPLRHNLEPDGRF